MDAEYALRKLIDSRIEDYLKANNYVKIISATVVSYNSTNQTAICYIAGDLNTTTATYPNRSGVSLVAGNEVEIVMKHGKLTGAFIAWKR